eukprot:UN18398
MKRSSTMLNYISDFFIFYKDLLGLDIEI